MIRHLLIALTAITLVGNVLGQVRSNSIPVASRRWFEARSAHFNIYSCGPTQDVANLSFRLEQFRDAYSLLTSAQAVASPPIVVMAFPDHDSMEPFLPLYQGKPVSMSGFFHRGTDENLIVLALSKNATNSLDVIFHEYTHLLFRRNDLIWPAWLQEGMAEIYSTFEINGRGVRIGKPVPRHLRLLQEQPLMPLHDLFNITQTSPQYNESEMQGIFYAQSWLLTHYLMLGQNTAHKANFPKLTGFLIQGQSPEQAFSSSFQTSLPTMEAELRKYLQQGKFESAGLVLSSNISAPRPLAWRALAPVETAFRLGNELLRIKRYDTAEKFFSQAQKMTPASPLPYEGLGLLASRQDKPQEAVRQLKESLKRGSTSFLAHYVYARETFQLTADSQQQYTRLKDEDAEDIRSKLNKSIQLMPNFGPAHHLLGFFELVQGDDLAAAEKQLRLAIQLEPENQSYFLSLAQALTRSKNFDAARRALAPLRLPNVDKNLRAQAEEMLKEINLAAQASTPLPSEPEK